MAMGSRYQRTTVSKWHGARGMVVPVFGPLAFTIFNSKQLYDQMMIENLTDKKVSDGHNTGMRSTKYHVVYKCLLLDANQYRCSGRCKGRIYYVTDCFIADQQDDDWKIGKKVFGHNTWGAVGETTNYHVLYKSLLGATQDGCNGRIYLTDCLTADQQDDDWKITDN